MADKNISSAKSDISVEAPAGGKKPFAAASALAMGANVKKRWMMVGMGVAVTISGLAAVMSGSEPVRAVRVAPGESLETTPKGLNANNDWKAQTGAEVQELRKGLSDSMSAQKELLARMEAMRLEMSNLRSQEAARPSAAAPTTGRIDFTLPPPPEAPKALAPLSTSPAGVTASAGPANAPTSFAPPAPGTPVPVAIPKTRSAAKAFLTSSAEDAATEETTSRVDEMVPNEKKGYLPAGSFAEATLISGLEAFTGGTAASQPQPVVLRIDSNAILPNAARYSIKGCHILASAYGDMSSERVFGRTATLTCVDTNNKLVLSEEVEGTLVDSDGKNGIRGKLQDRQGAKLARALLAGFAEGMASAFGTAQTTSTSTAAGITSALTGSSVKAAGYGGAANATQQLADFYLKQAEATMPVIAVDAGRKVSILFTKSKSLSFETVGKFRNVVQEGFTVAR